jgi:hypothetical protein
VQACSGKAKKIIIVSSSSSNNNSCRGGGGEVDLSGPKSVERNCLVKQLAV